MNPEVVGISLNIADVTPLTLHKLWIEQKITFSAKYKYTLLCFFSLLLCNLIQKTFKCGGFLSLQQCSM